METELIHETTPVDLHPCFLQYISHQQISK